jgi:hypothetical protein
MKFISIFSIQVFLICCAFANNKNISLQINRIFSIEKDSKFISFGNNWIFDSFMRGSNEWIRLYRGINIVKTEKLNTKSLTLYSSFNNNPLTSMYSIIDINKKITIFTNNTLNKIYFSNFMADKISYLNQSTLTAYNILTKTLYVKNIENLNY